jgi:transposase
MKAHELKRYSEAFKTQVIAEVESGQSLTGAARKYGIGASASIGRWLKDRGKNHLVPKVVRVETVNEPDRIKAILAEKQRLESALAQSQLKVMALEEVIKIAEENYHVDFKKKSGPKSLQGSEGPAT